MHVLALYPGLSTLGPLPQMELLVIWSLWVWAGAPGVECGTFPPVSQVLQPLQDWDTEWWGVCSRASPHKSKAWPSRSPCHTPEIFRAHNPSSLLQDLMRNYFVLYRYACWYFTTHCIYTEILYLKFELWGWQGSLFELVWLFRTSVCMKL